MLLLKLVLRDSLGHVPKNLLSMCLIVHIDFGWVAGKLQKGARVLNFVCFAFHTVPACSTLSFNHLLDDKSCIDFANGF